MKLQVVLREVSAVQEEKVKETVVETVVKGVLSLTLASWTLQMSWKLVSEMSP